MGKSLIPIQSRLAIFQRIKKCIRSLHSWTNWPYFCLPEGSEERSDQECEVLDCLVLALSEYEKKHLEVLSKGNQQKIQIATFLNDPDILILDEPFSGLDPVNAQVFKDIIVEFAKNDKLVIFFFLTPDVLCGRTV